MIILGENTFFNKGYKANANNLVVGAPGTGKSRGFVLPNLAEAENESYLVLDAKGEIYDLTRKMMEKKGYTIHRLDFDEPSKSTVHYNPFNFIKSQEDIIEFSNVLVNNKRTVDEFWEDTARILNNALVAYLLEARPAHQQVLESVYKLMRHCTAYEDDSRETQLDRVFAEMKTRCPTSWALGQYELVRNSAARTFRSVAISLSSAFASVMTPDVFELTSAGGVQVDPQRFCTEKTILYVTVSDIDRSKDKLASLFITQFIQQLYQIADRNPKHSLPRSVHIILDDIGANLQIPNLDGLISTSRGRDISFSLILQSFGQLKKHYDDYTSIISSCNNLVFMGSNDIDTCYNIATRLNRPVGDVLYKEKKDIFVFQQGEKPVTTRVYDIRKHRMYSLLNDKYVPENTQKKNYYDRGEDAYDYKR